MEGGETMADPWKAQEWRHCVFLQAEIWGGAEKWGTECKVGLQCRENKGTKWTLSYWKMRHSHQLHSFICLLKAGILAYMLLESLAPLDGDID